jgi:tRNA-(ms[2]io[6]A)-hydroxylase
MLNLASETDPQWVEDALAEREVVLIDHTHCEKKAAGAAVRLLFSYPHHRFLQEPLSRLAREELEHFETLLSFLDRRGIVYRSMPPSPYGARLHRLVRREEPDRAVDVLLVAALIEARSCERMRLLAEAIEGDEELADFLRELLPCEARHHRLYVDLAVQVGGREPARARLAELALAEAKIIAEPTTFVRLHTGPLAMRVGRMEEAPAETCLRTDAHASHASQAVDVEGEIS